MRCSGRNGSGRDVGLVRAKNQDSLAAVPAATEKAWRERGHLFVVADGMGGAAAGEVASGMAVEVVVPEDNLGAVLGDLQSRHALIRDTRTEAGNVTIDCEVALERILGYTTDLRSQTQGRGQFSMQFERFDLV